MDIVWFGQSCFKIKGKKITVVVDPFDPEATGLKLPTKDLEAQLVLSSHSHGDHNNVAAVSGSPVIINGPGEYEVQGVSVVGVGTFHDSTQGSKRGKNTVYNILIDEVHIVHLGDLGHQLTEEQRSEIGQTDILMVPAGGVYTIDPEEAAKVVAELEPRVVIPMHYRVPGLVYDLAEAGEFLKEMGAESVTPMAKLSLTKDKLPDEIQVVILTKS